jgi:hypothetical protein
MLRRFVFVVFVLGLIGGADWFLPTARAGAPALQEGQGAERTVWYFYRVKWGYQNEFVDLYQKNHYPVLKAQLGDRVVDFKAYVPSYHGDGRSDWTFATVMTFRDGDALLAPANDAEIARGLFPDLDVFQAEEQRRFEIVDAHWDVPLTEVDLETRIPAGP